MHAGDLLLSRHFPENHFQICQRGLCSLVLAYLWLIPRFISPMSHSRTQTLASSWNSQISLQSLCRVIFCLWSALAFNKLVFSYIPLSLNALLPYWLSEMPLLCSQTTTHWFPQIRFYLCHQESYLPLHIVDVRREESISILFITVFPPHSTGHNEKMMLNIYCKNTWINETAYDY